MGFGGILHQLVLGNLEGGVDVVFVSLKEGTLTTHKRKKNSADNMDLNIKAAPQCFYTQKYTLLCQLNLVNLRVTQVILVIKT